MTPWTQLLNMMLSKRYLASWGRWWTGVSHMLKPCSNADVLEGTWLIYWFIKDSIQVELPEIDLKDSACYSEIQAE